MQKRWGNRKFSSEHHRSIYCRQEPLMLKLVKKAQGRQNIREDPQNLESICKKLCIYSYMFKLQSPSKYSPLDAMHLSRCFFHGSKQFLNLQILMPFSASVVFCFTSSTSMKRFLLRILFIQGNRTKSFRMGLGKQGGRIMLFWVKNC